MKARTLIVTIGATVALVGGAGQAAGAEVASTCASAHKAAGYNGSGWSYPTSTKKVLVVGNGTKAPYYVTVPRTLQAAGGKSCSTVTKPVKQSQKPKALFPVYVPPSYIAEP